MYTKLFSAVNVVALQHDGPAGVFRRYASLSAIHRGLRNSGRTPAGPSRSVPAPGTRRRPIRDGGGPRIPPKLSYKERKEVLDDHQKLKDRIGSKHVKEPAIPKALTRRARFFSPDSNFGKKSIVYQAKSGQLEEEIRKLQKQVREAGGKVVDAALPRQPFKFESHESTRPSSRERPSRRSRPERTPDRRSGRGRESGKAASQETLFTPEEFARSMEGAGAHGDARKSWSSVSRRRPDDGKSDTRRDVRERARGPKEPWSQARSDSTPDRPPRRGRDEDSTESRPSRFGKEEWLEGRGRAGSREESPSEVRHDSGAYHRMGRMSAAAAAILTPEEEMTMRRIRSRARSFSEKYPDAPGASQPVSIPYTTAASQFLYGKSEVEAAMLASRRQLYKLYVYGGENRQDVQRDADMERLATQKRVETVVVREDGLRLLDKMAGGRPHNGYVLEASPLPQRPLTALGPVSTDARPPGFRVEGAHQSVEDARINGTADFFASRSSTHKPFVVALDQIVDPGNLGAILRSVSFLGADAVVIVRRGSATLTPVALKASSGAAESLTIFAVDNLMAFLGASQENGWKVYAAAPAPTRSWQARHVDVHSVQRADPLATDPCVLVVGNEGEGLSRQVKHKADYEVNIPNMSGATNVDSLNVSVATGLLCSAFLGGQVQKQVEEFAQTKKTSDALF